ncbi:MAG: 4Fe-4S binding protein [Chloroflexota bacterium]
MQKNWLDRLIKPSTRRFVQAARQEQDYSFFDLLHGLVYGLWPYLYIGIGVGEHPLAKKLSPWLGRLERLRQRLPAGDGQTKSPGNGIADTYHGKVMPLESAKRLVQVREPIRAPDLEQVIPYPRARALILQNPEHIVALECPCRAARPNPCLPLDVCLIVGEPFASLLIEHHPQRSRWVSTQEAVTILEAEDERGHVHHAFFKDAMLGRFYAICNCCSCCCGAMQAQRNGTPMLASSGYLAQVDADLCIGCGECQDFCEFGALSLPDGFASVDAAACMGCGVCVGKCVQGALSLRLEASKGVPLEVDALLMR